MLEMSKKELSGVSAYFAIKLRIFIAFLIMSLTAAHVEFAQLGYGSRINAIHAVNSEGKDVIIPPEGVVSILFFFDINSPPHINVLNSLNFLLINLDQRGKVKLFAISKGEGETFKKIRSKYNIIFDLINDKQVSIFTNFNRKCQ